MNVQTVAMATISPCIVKQNILNKFLMQPVSMQSVLMQPVSNVQISILSSFAYLIPCIQFIIYTILALTLYVLVSAFVFTSCMIDRNRRFRVLLKSHDRLSTLLYINLPYFCRAG